MDKIKKIWKKFISMNGAGVFLAMVAFIILVSFLAPSITGGNFLTLTNITNVFRQQSHIGIICCAMTYIIITGNIDLSVGSMLTLLSILCAKFTQINPVFAIFATLGCGLLLGMFNGMLVTGLRLNAFISTLATGSIYGALALIIAAGKCARADEPIFNFIGSGSVGIIPTPVVICIITLAIFWFILKRTVYGQRLYAIGANQKASRYSGIRTRRDVFIAYALCGLCVGLAAIIYIARSVSANPQVAAGKEMDIVLAVVLGGTSILGGKGSIGGTIIGFLFIGFMSAGFTFLGLDQYLQWIILGAILVFALAVDVASEKGVKLWKRKAKKS